METTFTHEVKFISQVPNEGDVQKGILPFIEEKTITKTATFKELSRTDKGQSKFAWKIQKVFETNGEKTVINDEVAHDLAYIYIEENTIINEDFTQQDKIEMLNDTFAIMQFGLWLIHNKILPFFLSFLSYLRE